MAEEKVKLWVLGTIFVVELLIIGSGIYFYLDGQKQKAVYEQQLKESEIRMIDTLNAINRGRERIIQARIDSVSAIKQKTVTRLTKEKKQIHDERISNGRTSSSMPRF